MKKIFFLWLILILGVCVLIAIISNCVFDTSGICVYQISSSYPPNGCKDLPYSFQFTATCGKEPYIWNIASGNKPPGLNLDPKSGFLSGKPTLEGSFTFYVEVTDKNKDNLLEEYTISIKEFNITDSTIHLYYCLGESFNYKISTCGGKTPFTWTIKSGSLPSGIKIEQDGRISGTTSTTGKFTFTVQVKDNNGKTAEKEYILHQIKGISIQPKHPLPLGQVSKPYPTYKFQALCGQSPFTWSNPDGVLKKIGLSLNTKGELSGTPVSAGDFKFKVKVEDGTKPKPKEDENNFYITILPAPLVITSTSPLKDATECKSYSYTFTASGGTKKYTWSIPSGSQLPKGLTLNSLGKLQGKPEVPKATPYSFSVQVSDTKSTTSKTFTLKVLEDTYVTPQLAIIAIAHDYKTVDTISISEKTKTVKVIFNFPTAPNLLQNLATSARLQVVEGDCSYIANTGLITLFDRDGDNVDDSRLAIFSPQLVAAMLNIAKKKAGDTVRLRFWVDVTVDKKPKTFVHKRRVNIIQ